MASYGGPAFIGKPVACREKDRFLDDLGAEDADAPLADLLGQPLVRCISFDHGWLMNSSSAMERARLNLSSQLLTQKQEEVDLSGDGQEAAYGLSQVPKSCLEEAEIAQLRRALLSILKYHADAQFVDKIQASQQSNLVRIVPARPHAIFECNHHEQSRCRVS